MGRATAGRAGRWALGGVAALALLVGGGALAVVLGRGRAEPPRHDEARDLPALPAPADNGWTVIAAAPAATFRGDDPPTNALLTAREGPPDLAALEEIREEIADFAIPGPARAAIEDALARPRFVVSCPLDPTAPLCPVIDSIRAHRLASAIAIGDALEGFDEEALARAERLARADRDALQGARTAIAAMTAAVCAAEAIELAALLAAIVAAREEGPGTPEVGARLDALERAVVSLEPASWSMEQALVGEAITMRRGLDAIAAEPRWIPMDHGRTAARLEDSLEDAIAYARDPEGAPPPALAEPGPVERLLDPAGAEAIETVLFALTPVIDRFEEHALEAEDRLAVARVAIAAARARTERAEALAPPLDPGFDRTPDPALDHAPDPAPERALDPAAEPAP